MLYKRPLTDRGILGLKPAKDTAYQLSWDALVPGLAVRVTNNGTKTFVLVTRFPGSRNPTARSLGKVGKLTLADARNKARDWYKLISGGIDPADATSNGDGTFKAICEDYLRRDATKLRTVDQVRSKF